MQGTDFKNGVLTTQVDLNRAQSSKAEEIMTTRVELASRGIISGGEVTVNLSNTDRIDIAAFEGFTPRGDYIVSAISNNNYPLTDYTVGVNNFILAVYTENLTGNKPHESDGSVYPTRIEHSYRILVLTEAEYLNPSVLNPSDNNLTNDARDRSLILAIVSANGPSIPLIDSNIQSPVDFNNLLYANPTLLPTMLGVDIKYVDPTTATGSGNLEYQFTSSQYQLRWASPGGSVGAWQTWTVDGEKVVTDSLGKYLRINMAVSQMDTVGSFPYTQAIEILDLYYQEIPRNSAEDTLHRSLRGTGVISSVNPHGNSINDFTDESLFLLDEHQDTMHCNGIWKGSLPTVLSSFVVPSSPYDSLGINIPSNSDLYYINGVKLSTLTNTSFSFSPAFAGTVSSMWEGYVTDQAEAGVSKKLEYPAARTVRGTWIINTSDNYSAGTYELQLRVVSGSPTKFYFSWDSGTEVLVNEGDADRALRLFSLDGLNYVDLWVRSSASGSSDAFLPSTSATYTDDIIIFDSVSLSNNLHVSNITYWYDSISAQTFIGYAPYSVSRSIVDKRTWGNICEDNINDSFLQEHFYHPNKELGNSGILRYRDDYNYPGSFNYITGGLNLIITGGHSYCRGRRLATPGKVLTLSANKKFMSYVDTEGALLFLNVTDDFSNDRDLALRYLLGNSAYREAISEVYHANVSGTGIPERGVPLYYVETGSSTITSVLDISRNTNGVSNPWSVGEGEGLAFATMEAAFMYAGIYDDASVIITVAGVVIPSEILEQPANVSVVGSSIASGITFSNLGSGSSTGVWHLNNNCVVKNLNIDTSNVSHLFGLSKDILISSCSISTASDTFLFGDNSASSVKDVKIINNNFYLQGLLEYGAFPSPEIKGWLISGNTIRSSSSGFSVDNSGLICGSFGDTVISNNILYPSSGSSGRLAAGIALTDSASVTINCNTISVGAGDGSVIEPGIILEKCDTVSISGNVIQKDSSNSNKASVGIYLTIPSYISNTSISGNSFSYLNTGVYGGSVTETFSFSIISNTFYTMYSSAIDCVLARYDSVTISDNVVENIVYSASSHGFLKNVNGINIEVSGGSSCKNLLILNNNISNLESSGSVPTVGIKVTATAGSYSLLGVGVKGNIISSIEYSGSSSSSPLKGIDVSVSGSNVFGINITDNDLSDLNSTYHIYGIGVFHGATSNGVDSVVISRNTMSACYVEDTQSESKTSRMISAYGSVGSGDVVINDNVLDFVTLTTYAGNFDYVPRGIYVSRFEKCSLKGNKVQYLGYTNPFYTYSGYGVYIEEVEISELINNSLIVPRGMGLYVEDSTQTNVINNDIRSSLYGILLSTSSGFCTVVDNKVGIIPQENIPSSGLNNVFDNSACIVMQSDAGFNLSRNRTYSTLEVHRVNENNPSATDKSHHILIDINDLGTVDSNAYKVENNYIDLNSQGINSSNFSMSGITFLQGTNYNSSVNHLISFTGNTLAGGRDSGTGSLPALYNPAYEPTVVYFDDLDVDSGKGSYYFVSNNTSIQGEGGISNIVWVNDTSTFVTADTNMDHYMMRVSATLW